MPDVPLLNDMHRYLPVDFGHGQPPFGPLAHAVLVVLDDARQFRSSWVSCSRRIWL